MTPSPPDEAIHIRGKTLTPESPRPLHIQEPSSIPVLQNQMDPVFNDTATHLEKPKPSQDHVQLYQRAPEDGSFPGLVNGGNNDGGSGAGDGGDDEVDGDHEVGSGPAQGQQTGSFHSEPLQIDGSDGSMHKNDTSLSTAAANAFPSNHASSATTEPSLLPHQDTAVHPALTALPSDPSHLPPPPLDPHQATSHNPSQASHAALDSVPYQLGSFANKVDAATDPNSTQPTAQPTAPGGGPQAGDSGKDTAPSVAEDGVDFQNLLDNLTSSGPAVTATVSSHANDSIPQSTADSSLPTPAGLPPRPPPQEKPSIHPNYAPSDDIRSYHQFPSQNTSPSTTAAAYTPQQSNNYLPNNSGLSQLVAAPPGAAPGTSSGANGLPPPPVATFQQQPQQSPVTPQEPSTQSSHKGTRLDRYSGRPSQAGDDEAPWGPEVQKKYDEFLHDERVYVTEGLWDRFPQGSRLFVGNLPTERVTKRDLFHIFHKYGKLAQISIKQAYGFVQFLDAESCYQALQGEQGGVVRGRKIHLEISKPQRNSRQGPPPSEPSRASASRRSRSPEYRGGTGGSRGTRAQGGDRHDRSYDSGRPPFSDFRDEPASRRRDDYRLPRSPSPRGFRGRDEYRSRDRSPERYDRRDRRRSRSPYGRDRRYRSPSPRGRAGYDSDSDLPFPRRAPRDVPDVQIIILDDVDRNFIFHVESSFKNRGLRVDVLTLPPRVSLSATVQRQIDEGVLAIVKLSRSNQYSGKVPLQVFDRSGGVGNVRFNEYSELDLAVAAEMAVHAQSLQRAGVSPAVYPPNPAFPAPSQFPPAQPQPQPAIPALSNPSQIAQLISSLDGPTLQSLLAALQQAQTASQPTQQPFPATQPGNPVDLASLLSNATRHQNPVPPVQNQPPSHPLPAQPFGLPVQPNASVVPDPNLISLLAKGLGGGKPPQNQATVAPQVQNIVNQLAKWKQ
ncbi:hypothetical protein VTN77DRAFT_7137 [Rasamsonia byssochlamydoides]|uniref:uncharacterized protein n=1 Tax=Rasamsonia byssochlamydoides TaxID=89139 RepID=UPI0037447D9A